jgi:hypothetical protein
MSDFPYDWTQPYRWRTYLRSKLPWVLNGVFHKGKDCEVAGGLHHWYNINNVESGCYHCYVTREGQLWKKPDSA